MSHRPRRAWVRRLFWLLLVAAVVATAVWYFPRPQTQPREAGRGPSGAPVPVGVSPVAKGYMPVTLSQLGTVTPLAMVTVKTQISGYLVQVAFKEGQMVTRAIFSPRSTRAPIRWRSSRPRRSWQKIKRC